MILTVSLVEMLGHMVYPPPEGLDPAHPETIIEAMKTMPGGALLAVVIAWILGAFAGSITATLIARHMAVTEFLMEHPFAGFKSAVI